MLEKSIIKKNFKKSLETYDNCAVVQKQMAKKLTSMLDNKKYQNILEIGSYTGILTKNIIKKVEFENYLALDIIDSGDYIKKIDSRICFIKEDIEEFLSSKKFDLIISNAALQWCNDFIATIENLKKMLNPTGIMALSIFAYDNLAEIKNTFNSTLNYIETEKLEEIFPDAEIIFESIELQFNNPIEILRHLKKTGVNSIKKGNFSFFKLRELEKRYDNKITYKPLYIKFRKSA